MFSQTVEYALRAAVFLASEDPQPQTTAAIAEATKVPAAYLSKVLQGLREHGIVKSQRGVGGGMALARPPAKLSILDIVNAVEPVQRIKTCPLGLQMHGMRLCPLHRRMDEALAGIEKAFGETTLAEMLSDPNSRPLCRDAPQLTQLRIK